MEIKEKIKNLIKENEVCLFMKGTPDSPQCGFSMAVSNVLKHLKVNFKGINVLEDEQLRQGIKDFSDWPTIPQLYVKEEFVGGSDIVKEMFEKGELTELLKNKIASTSKSPIPLRSSHEFLALLSLSLSVFFSHFLLNFEPVK